MGTMVVPVAKVVPRRGRRAPSPPRRAVRVMAATLGTGCVVLTSLGLLAWARVHGEVALQVFVGLVSIVSVSCTYLLWWHRRGSLWRKALWTLVLLVPASGHLYFLAAYRVRDDEL